MLVLGVNGSPRKDGVSARLLRAALHGAREEGDGVETEELFLYGMEVAPSDGCPECVGECTIIDDNSKLYSLYREMDALIVSLPIYFQNVPAHVKAAIDRTQALWTDKSRNKRRISPYKRPGAAILTGGSEDFLQFGYTWHVMRSWYTTVEARMLRSIFIPSLDEKPAREREKLFEEHARQMGREIAALAHDEKRRHAAGEAPAPGSISR